MAKRQKIEFSLSTVLANTTTKRQIEGFVDEIIIHKSAQKSASLGIKDIVGEAKDALGIPGKVLMKLVREKMDPGIIEHQLEELEEALKLSDGLGISDSLGNNARGTGPAATGSAADSE
jgi:hypothetical protein